MCKNHNTKYYRHLRSLKLHFDGYACQNCGEISFSNEVHHLSWDSSTTTTFSGIANLFLDLDQLITLCRPCHKVLHKIYR